MPNTFIKTLFAIFTLKQIFKSHSLLDDTSFSGWDEDVPSGKLTEHRKHLNLHCSIAHALQNFIGQNSAIVLSYPDCNLNI